MKVAKLKLVGGKGGETKQPNILRSPRGPTDHSEPLYGNVGLTSRLEPATWRRRDEKRDRDIRKKQLLTIPRHEMRGVS